MEDLIDYQVHIVKGPDNIVYRIILTSKLLPQTSIHPAETLCFCSTKVKTKICLVLNSPTDNGDKMSTNKTRANISLYTEQND